MDLMLMHFEQGHLADRRLADIHSFVVAAGLDLDPDVPLATATEFTASSGDDVWHVYLSESVSGPVDFGGAFATIKPRGPDEGALYTFCRLARYVIQRVSFVIVVNSDLERDLPEDFGQDLVHVSSPEELFEALLRD